MTPEIRSQAAAMLTRSRALIDAPEKWTKSRMFELRDGHQCRCLIAAMRSVENAGTLVYQEADSMLRQLSYKRLGVSQLGTFNDLPDTTHADVISLLDEAIAELTP